MKTLDRRAAEIFRSMLALQTTKIDNSDGTYMPDHIELIGRIDKYDFFSLAHYGQQNGDAMRDPEMLFALHKDTRQFIPYYYRNAEQRQMVGGWNRAESSLAGRTHHVR